MTLKNIVLSIVCAAMVASCATAARYTLQDRFRAIGLPPDIADCMVDELDQRLTDEDLQDLARYTFNVARQDTTLNAIQALMEIDNPRAVTAIGRSGVSCVTGFSI
ncbi:MAG: hypothetical protein HKN14_12480 [Marinicaulis sp.]|nr:hypothetical protein [Marinicaulis sp.]NNL88846.1 hypothetical protein [Marinicaulis sp.]